MVPSSDRLGEPHDPRFELARQEALSLLALGQPVELELDSHIRGCESCQAELSGLRRTVALAREADIHRHELEAVPSPLVWDRIATQLRLAEPAPKHVHRFRFGSRFPRNRILLLAAAVLIALGGVGIGYLVGSQSGGSRPSITATARLAQMPGGPTDVSGTASIHGTSDGEQLTVRTGGLPLRAGYYEVWLFNPTSNKMVAVGTLGKNGGGSFPVPPGLDVRDYHVVDVSAQDYDGNPVHKQSVLRGGLTQ